MPPTAKKGEARKELGGGEMPVPFPWCLKRARKNGWHVQLLFTMWFTVVQREGRRQSRAMYVFFPLNSGSVSVSVSVLVLQSHL